MMKSNLLSRHKGKFLKLQLVLLFTQTYLSCSAPFGGLTGLVGLSAVSSLVLDDDKPSTYIVDEIRSSIYENYMREVTENITDGASVRRATLRFINGLASQKANQKLCFFYNLRPNNEEKLTTAQILIYIFFYVKTPSDWDDRFKLDVLLPLGLTSSSRVKAEFKIIEHLCSPDLINEIASGMAAIPTRKTPAGGIKR